MLFAVNMGNSQIKLGILEHGKLILREHFSTDLKKTDTEYAALIHMVLEINQISRDRLSGAILSSVVPPLTNPLKRAIQKAVGLVPLVVGPGVKNGLKIKIDNPKTLGSDIVVDMVGAADLYPSPLMVIDLGAATTITYLDQNKNYCGGAIMPGLLISSEALAAKTSQLPHISLDHPGNVIGKNTVDALKSGALFGHAAMIDGMIDRILAESHAVKALPVATGEVAEIVIPYCMHQIRIDPDLSFHGLEVIFRKNR